MISIPWYFVDVVNRPSIFAYFYLIITFLTLFGVCTSIIIDRYSRKKVFIYTNLVCGSVIAWFLIMDLDLIMFQIFSIIGI